jgi:hypothetical protein
MYILAVEAAKVFIVDRGEPGRCFLHLVGDFAINIHAGHRKYIKKAILELSESTSHVRHDGFFVLEVAKKSKWSPICLLDDTSV